MNIETFVLVGVIYVIGCYVTAFLMGIGNAVDRITDDGAEWFMSVFWPICILTLVVLGLAWLFKFLSTRLKSRFPAMTRDLKRTWKRIRTAIFVVSLVFRPIKFGEIVGKRIFRNRT